jgi:16S rRNA C967 or C1407 C5-methylase (RsmB/RsmF family)/NOL1/NOP2/fmu family ribosome biogenesis protein
MNLPTQFKQQMKAQLGTAYTEFEAALQKPSPVSLRLHPQKITSNTVALTKIPWAANGYYLPERPFFTTDPIFRAGGYYVQEASSMLLAKAVQQHCNTKQSIVLDLCAAPGGKSTHLLDLFDSNSLIVSNEVIGSRSKILKENIQKWGHSNTIVTNNDSKHFETLNNFFDVIVVDAPCSGEGMFRKLRHSIEEWSPANVELCANRQKRILATIWNSLKPNGILIYSTCTYNSKENEENVQWAIEELGATSLQIDLPPSVHCIQYKEAYNYRCYPHLVEGEGFSISVLQKGNTGTPYKFKKIKKSPLEKPNKKTTALANSYINEPTAYQWYNYQDTLHLFPKSYQKELEVLVNQLRVIYFGASSLEITKKGLKPSAYFAFNQAINIDAFTSVIVNWEQAMEFMRGETLSSIEIEEDGWILLCYNDNHGITLPIGFIKKIKNRINNYFPKEWKTKINWERILNYSNQKII